MKRTLLSGLAGLSLLFSQCAKTTAPQQSATTQAPAPVAAAPKAKEYKFETVAGDSLKARIYTLDNGLKVYLTDYKDAPRIQTYIAVRAGSKNDPATATGLAHYLEHMVFKGTSRLGAKEYEKEKAELDKIEALYNQYRKTTDQQQRKRIYHQIDSISGVAATYAVANEYDKLVGAIGTKNSNAYTFLEQTVYTGSIPANQLNRWAMIESERFRELVPRLFHTELEAVYEEKNRSLDSDDDKVYEALFRALFPTHPYGTQTTIGTVEHLKNPSITEIKKFFDTYYVPNNMAICLSGDLDMDQTIRLLDRHFGQLKPKPVPEWKAPAVTPIQQPVSKEVVGPEVENVTVGFRFPGYSSREALVLSMITQLLTNGQAGLIDLNLNQKQKVLSAGSFPLVAHDYSAHILSGTPREGQKLEAVRDLLLSQVELVKKGSFPDWLIPAVQANEKIRRMEAYENNAARADAFVTAFIMGLDWKEYVKRQQDFFTITKEEVMQVANKFYGSNYVVVYKRTGEDKNIEKVEKPTITPVAVNREAQSAFYALVMKEKAPELKPVFLDYEKDITRASLKQNLPLHYLRNKENGLFDMYYIIDKGTDQDPKLGLAVQYLKFLGTDQYTAEQLQQEFFKLGCSFDVFSDRDQVYVSLSGLDENLTEGVRLFESLLAKPKADPEALKDMVAGILKERQDAKLNKNIILRMAMVNYAKYGPKNPFTNIVPEKELKKLKPEELLSRIRSLNSFEHRVLYYGPRPLEQLTQVLNAQHQIPAKLQPVPETEVFAQLPFNDRQVLWTNYDMVQAEIMILSKSVPFNAELVPRTKLFNEYFGGNMGSIVFQELRESKALAYATSSTYSQAQRKAESNYVMSYIGTQSDKLPEAMQGMEGLLDEMPLAEENFRNAKESIRNTIAAERITKGNILMSYEKARKLGLNRDIRQDVYQNLDAMSFEDLKRFQQQYVKGQNQKILVLGDRKRLNFKELGKYGQVKEVTLKELFGY